MNEQAIIKNIICDQPDGAMLVDEQGVVKQISPSLCSLLGYHRDEILDKALTIFMYQRAQKLQKCANGIVALNENTLKKGEFTRFTAVKKDGRLLQMGITFCEIKTDCGPAYFATVYNLSPRQQAHEALKQQITGLEQIVAERTAALQTMVRELRTENEQLHQQLAHQTEAGKTKNRFAAMASHEFRSPLTNIQLSASLIEHYYNRLDQDKLMGHLKNIQASVTDLNTIITDFLSMEKIESGKLVPEYKDLDLVAFSASLIKEVSPQAKADQHITYQHLGNINRYRLDGNLLKHCVLNLLSNAIKYSAEGSTIDVETEVNKNGCYIRVKDQGIGILSEDKKQLFEPFYRGCNVSDVPGTGLGLNIVWHYVQLMQGQISFKSNKANGTVFTIQFTANALHNTHRAATLL